MFQFQDGIPRILTKSRITRSIWAVLRVERNSLFWRKLDPLSWGELLLLMMIIIQASSSRMSVDILGTNCDQCRSMVHCCFTSTETVRLIRTENPGQPPRLSHSSWTLWSDLCLVHVYGRKCKRWRTESCVQTEGLFARPVCSEVFCCLIFFSFAFCASLMKSDFKVSKDTLRTFDGKKVLLFSK